MSTAKPIFALIFSGLSLLPAAAFSPAIAVGHELSSGYLYIENTKKCFYTKAAIAKTHATRQRGFMDPPPPVGAVIFEWPEPTARNFWMKGTSTPLVLFRLKQSGIPQTFTELRPFDLTDHIDPTPEGIWAVEIRQDWPTLIPLEKLFFYRFRWSTAQTDLKGTCLKLHQP